MSPTVDRIKQALIVVQKLNGELSSEDKITLEVLSQDLKSFLADAQILDWLETECEFTHKGSSSKQYQVTRVEDSRSFFESSLREAVKFAMNS